MIGPRPWAGTPGAVARFDAHIAFLQVRLRRQIHRTIACAAVLAAVGALAPAAGAATSAGTAVARACKDQSKQRSVGTRLTPYARCVTALTRLVRARSRSPRMACAGLPRRREAGRTSTPFARCVRAGTRLIRNGNGIDRAFLEGMIPHHVGAVEMAQLALTRAQSDFIRTLAANIIRTQNEEIATMRQILERLRAAGIPAVSLGLTQAQMGMDHDVSHLVNANPFDVLFVDMMIPHHQGAVTMSNVLFARGVGARTRSLARQITRDQLREIQMMRDFRAQIPGAPPPTAGGHAGHRAPVTSAPQSPAGGGQSPPAGGGGGSTALPPGGGTDDPHEGHEGH